MTPLRIGRAAASFALLLCVAAQAADQEAKVTASISPNPVTESESAQFVVDVEAPISVKVGQPAFSSPEFTVMGNPGMSFTPVNGPQGVNTRKKLSFTYVLMPRRAGDFKVTEIKVPIENEFRMAPEVNVKVAPGAAGRATGAPATADDEASNPAHPNYQGGARPAPGSQGQPSTGRPTPSAHPSRFNSDFTVHAVASKTRSYVGEPVVVEYYLYDYGHVRQADVLKWPTFDGFWKEDLHLTMKVAFEEVFVQNQEMRRAFLARYALYGIKPGKRQVDKLGIKGKYVGDEALAPGFAFGFDMRTGQHFSQDLEIEVLPLPEAGRPANFGGAVGQFNLKLEANRLSLPQNSPITFSLNLSGIGNFQAIDSIKLTLPPDFEIYDTTAIGRTAPPIGQRQELESKKTFQVTAIPRKAGKFEIAPVKWSYFDPDKERYETISTEALTVEVSESSTGGGETGNNTYLGKDAKPGTTTETDWRPWKSVPAGAPSKTRILPWLALAALLVNLALAFRRLREQWRKLFHLVKGVDRFSEARIALLQAKGIRDSEWQAGLEEVLLMTMQVLLETNPRGLPKYELEELWKAKGLPAPIFQRMDNLLGEIDRHRFSSQKLAGSGTKELRSRLTRETESLLAEASRLKRK